MIIDNVYSQLTTFFKVSPADLKIMNSNLNRTSWLQLRAEVSNLTAPALMPSTEDKLPLNFYLFIDIHSF